MVCSEHERTKFVHFGRNRCCTYFFFSLSCCTSILGEKPVFSRPPAPLLAFFVRTFSTPSPLLSLFSTDDCRVRDLVGPGLFVPLCESAQRSARRWGFFFSKQGSVKLKRESVHHEGHRHLAGGARGWSPSPHGSRQTRIEVEAAAAPDRDSRRREAPVVDVVACHISPEVISFSSVDEKK